MSTTAEIDAAILRFKQARLLADISKLIEAVEASRQEAAT